MADIFVALSDWDEVSGSGVSGRLNNWYADRVVWIYFWICLSFGDRFSFRDYSTSRVVLAEILFERFSLRDFLRDIVSVKFIQVDGTECTMLGVNSLGYLALRALLGNPMIGCKGRRRTWSPTKAYAGCWRRARPTPAGVQFDGQTVALKS